ncbi:MAG: type I 3-dehydroquinate dehydratase, partial [Planctomycetaceae bacterium]|nr:type I 3-dehydroquinate dehydratase [Planctomycetaceae bacterium]
MLLRQAIVAGPDYIELDLDIAAKVPRFGKTKRVISFTRLDGPETDIERIFNEAARHDADVVKYTWPIRTLDDAWPLMAAVTQKRNLPVVGMGLGQPDITFSILGRKYGSPWVYAALEHGMEAHAGQATVFDLNEVYDFAAINRQTQFIGVAGFGEAARSTIRTLNAGFRALDRNVRCLPIALGDLKQLERMLQTLHITGLLVLDEACSKVLPMAAHVEKTDIECQSLDLLLHRKDGWHGYNTLWRSATKLLEASLGRSKSGQRPLAGKNVLILGSGGATHSMAVAVSQREGLISVSGPDDRAALQLANLTGGRAVPFHNIYDCLVDVVIVADSNVRCGFQHGQLNPSLLKAGQTVLDLSGAEEHELLGEARERGCRVIEPRDLFAELVASRFRALSGDDLPLAALRQS